MRVIRFAVLVCVFSTIVLAQSLPGNFQFGGNFNLTGSGEKLISYDLLDGDKIRLVGSKTIRIWDIETKKFLESKTHGIENLLPQYFGGTSPDKTKMLVLGNNNSPAKI